MEQGENAATQLLLTLGNGTDTEQPACTEERMCLGVLVCDGTAEETSPALLAATVQPWCVLDGYRRWSHIHLLLCWLISIAWLIN
jgi:hypothetical protein